MKALLLNLLTMIQRNQMKNYYLYVPIIKASKAFSISSEKIAQEKLFKVTQKKNRSVAAKHRHQMQIALVMRDKN